MRKKVRSNRTKKTSPTSLSKDQISISFFDEIKNLIELTFSVQKKTKPQIFWANVQKKIIKIYALSFDLPKTDNVYDCSKVLAEITDNNFARLGTSKLRQDSFRRICYDIGNYSVIFNPLNPSEPTISSATLDFGIILDDLLDGHYLWQRNANDDRDIAVTLMRNAIKNRTALYILNLTRAVHFYLTKGKSARSKKKTS